MKHRLYRRHIFHGDDNRNSVDTHYFLHILLLNFGSTKHAGRAKSPSGIFWSVPKDIHFTILVIVCSSFWSHFWCWCLKPGAPGCRASVAQTISSGEKVSRDQSKNSSTVLFRLAQSIKSRVATM